MKNQLRARKKGQGALEYLMTYGWALLIIVVVGAALFALGVFNPTAADQCTGFTSLQYQDHLTTTTGFQITIINGEGVDINVTDIDFGTTDLDFSTGSLLVSAGSQVTLAPTTDPTTKSAGDTYSEEVVITYNNVGGITGKTARGTCSGIVA